MSAVAAARVSGRTRLLPGGGSLVIGLVVALVLFAVLYPLAWLLYGSLHSTAPMQPGQLTLQNYVRAYGDEAVPATLRNTIVFAVGQTLLSLAIGTWLGWVLTRTNTPGRGVFSLLALALFLTPTILAVVAWTMLLSPSSGLINLMLVAVFHLEEAPFDIYSMGGMIWVQGLFISPLAYLMIAPALAAVDVGQEEAARMSGASLLRVLRTVTFPVVRPAILSTALLMFIVGLESFDVPIFLGAPKGIFTYTSLIFSAIRVYYPPDYGVATALAVTLLVAAVVCLWLYRLSVRRAARFETVRGQGYRTAIIDLGWWRFVSLAVCLGFFLLTVFLPVGVIALASLMPFFGRLDWSTFEHLTGSNYEALLRHPALVRGFVNSVVLGVVAGGVCVLAATIVAFITLKSRLPGRGVLESVAMLPMSFPATVLGLALLWAYISLPIPVYGTIAILGIAYVTRYLPVGLRTISGGMVQLSGELEEASRMSGASRLYGLRRVILPLLRGSIAAAWLMLFMTFFRELSMSVVLSGAGNPVVSVVLYDYYQSGELGRLSAFGIVTVAAIVLVIWFARWRLRLNSFDFKVA